MVTFVTIFWECASKYLTWSKLVRCHGLHCSKASASYSTRCKASVVPNSDPCQIITPLVLVGLGLGVGEGLGLGNQIAISSRGVIIWQGVKNGHDTLVAGARLHWSREERRCQRERFVRAWLLAASALARRCSQQTEHSRGFGFQSKIPLIKPEKVNILVFFLKKNMQVLSATASLVLLFFLFWKACYLCCLPHVMLWRLSLIIWIIIYLIPQCLLNIL